jgi:hypothetical protein
VDERFQGLDGKDVEHGREENAEKDDPKGKMFHGKTLEAFKSLKLTVEISW